MKLVNDMDPPKPTAIVSDEECLEYMGKIQIIVTFEPSITIKDHKSRSGLNDISRYCSKDKVTEGIIEMVDEFFGRIFIIIDLLYMYDINLTRVIMKPNIAEKKDYFIKWVYGTRNLAADPFIILRDYFEERSTMAWDLVLVKEKLVRVEINNMKLLSVEMESLDRRDRWEDPDSDEGVLNTKIEYEKIIKIEKY